MKRITIWRITGRSKTFYNLYCPSTNERGICATTYLEGWLVNPETGVLVKRDEEGFIVQSECFEGFNYVNRKGDTYIRPARDPRIPLTNDALSRVSERIVANVDSYPTLKLRNIESVLRAPHDSPETMAKQLAAASGEIIRKLEDQDIELKPEPFTPDQRTEVYKAMVAMSHHGGTVRTAVSNSGEVIGLRASLEKYGSIDRLEASMRNEFAQRTNRIVETEYIFRQTGDKVFLDIVVSKAKGPVIFDHKYCFTRCGNSTRALVDQQLIDYILEYSA